MPGAPRIGEGLEFDCGPLMERRPAGRYVVDSQPSGCEPGAFEAAEVGEVHGGRPRLEADRFESRSDGGCGRPVDEDERERVARNDLLSSAISASTSSTVTSAPTVPRPRPVDAGRLNQPYRPSTRSYPISGVGSRYQRATSAATASCWGCRSICVVSTRTAAIMRLIVL